MSIAHGHVLSSRAAAIAQYGIGFALALWLGASHASAQALDSVIFHAGRVVPANGAVLVLVPTTGLLGAGAKAVPARVEITDAGKTVRGEVRELGWIENVSALSLDTTEIVGVGLAWTPIEPLRPGASYDVHVQVQAGSLNHASFKAGPAWPVAQPELALDTQLETRDTGQQEEHCCSAFIDGTGHEDCFISRYAQLPAVAPSFRTSEAAEHLEQFVYLYRAFSEDDTTLWETGFRTYDSPVAQVPFFSPRDQYCVEVQAMNLVDERVFHWSQCLPASDLKDPLPDPAQGIADGLRIEHCSVPQYGDVLQWCEINREPCASGTKPECAEYQALCSVSLPDALDVILAVQAARRGMRGQTSANGGTGAGDAAPTAQPSGLRHPTGGGCSATRLASDSDARLLLHVSWLACVLLLVRARRRRSGRLVPQPGKK